MECLLRADDAFGPQVNGCRDNFDFTLLFEQSFFQIAPCALLLITIPARATYLRKQNVKTLRTRAASVKQAAIAILGCTQLALLIVWSLIPMYQTRASIPAAALSFVASLALLLLSSLEHSRSVRPSAIINTYMLFSLLFDIPQARTLWLRPGPRSLPGIFTAGLVAKTVSLCLEARNKRRALFPAYRVYAPEALVSLYDRTVLWWLNPIFQRGFKGLISPEHLYPVDSALASSTLSKDFEGIWSRHKGRGKHCLVWALAVHCKTAILAFMIPRIVLSAFKLSQPLLINRVTGLMSERITGESTNAGRGLIGATALIYCGLALSNVLYKRQLQRFQTMLRGTLVSALYGKMLVTSADMLADNAAITLWVTSGYKHLVEGH
jgi:ATP-binding cassette subfamily C (CFTR/MRP) protein 1